MYNVCIIILSDREYTGEEEDSVGRKFEKYLKNENLNIIMYKIIPEVKSIYEEFLIKCCDEYSANLVVTIGNRELSEEVTVEISNNKESHLNVYYRKNTIIKNFEEDVMKKESEISSLVEMVKKV